MIDAELTDRQQREVEYHRQYATERTHLIDQPVSDGIITSPRRRWWNYYWRMYDRLMTWDLAGRKVLVPGCGFGDDVVQTARLGAEVHGTDISPDVVGIARERVRRAALPAVSVRTMRCEQLDYPDGYFDLVLCVDILHHVDLVPALGELRRVAKPDARVMICEVYTHTWLQRVRESAIVNRVVYPRVKPAIYGKDEYITEDERKLTQHDLRVVREYFPRLRLDFFYTLANRFFHIRHTTLTKLDMALLRLAGPRAGRLLGGRVLAWQ